MSLETRGKVRCMQSCYRWDLSRAILQNRNVGDKIVSPIIPLHYSDFQLELYPNGANKKYNKYISIFLKTFSGHMKVKFRLSILNIDNQKCATIERSETFAAHTGLAWGAMDFIRQSELTRNPDLFAKDNVLRIWCEISFGIAVYEMPMFDDCSSRKRPRLHASEPLMEPPTSCNHFEKYFDNEHRSDVKFLFFDSNCIHAHSLVLEQKSDAFVGLFSDDVSVSSPAIVNIKDISYQVMYEVIRFIYTDKVHNIDEFAVKLLEPAKRFMLEDLKILCSQHLCNTLSIFNVIDYLILAEDCNLIDLKDQAKQFVAVKMKEVINLPEFEALMTQRPDIALEIIRCNSNKQRLRSPKNVQLVSCNYDS